MTTKVRRSDGSTTDITSPTYPRQRRPRPAPRKALDLVILCGRFWVATTQHLDRRGTLLLTDLRVEPRHDRPRCSPDAYPKAPFRAFDVAPGEFALMSIRLPTTLQALLPVRPTGASASCPLLPAAPSTAVRRISGRSRRDRRRTTGCAVLGSPERLIRLVCLALLWQISGAGEFWGFLREGLHD